MQLEEEIKRISKEFGFDKCAITSAKINQSDKQFFTEWIHKDYHGEMHYLQNHKNLREDPTLLLENAKSVIVVLKNYYSGKDSESKYGISKYALGIDYHFVVKEKLNEVLSAIQNLDTTINGRCFVDSAPIFERMFARNAGLGWIGKNSMLINKDLGTFTFIGIILLDKELSYDEAFENEFCGNCTKCIDECPTGAILKEKTIDARKCISYLTIEKRGELLEDEKKQLSGWIFGCDVCQNVCPWNTKVKDSNELLFKIYEKELIKSREEWIALSGNQFKKQLKSSPLQRAGLKQIIRNVLAND